MIVWRLFYAVLTISVVLLLYGIYVLLSARSGLESTPATYAYGPESASLTVIEFFDYSCPDCRAVYPIITKAVADDGNIQFFPLPLAGPNTPGEYAMRLTYAAGLQGKYKEAYEYLMQNYRGSIDESNVTDLALATGMNDEQLKKDVKSEAVEQRIRDTGQQFGALGGTHIPMFFIGGKITYVPETTPTLQELQLQLKKARTP